MRSLRSTFLAALLVACPTLAGAQFLVGDQQYRCPAEEPACPAKKPLPAHIELTAQNGSKYQINFIEFKDNGQLWDPKEQDQALRFIRAAPENGKKTLLVVYVNGWKNNADERKCRKPPCGDVPKFRDTLLATLANDYPDLNVLGVYLAWRGLTLTVEPFKTISYWPGRGTARRVGLTGIRQAVDQIGTAVHPFRNRYFVILAGHSFGARVLENAVDLTEVGSSGLADRLQRLQQLSLKSKGELDTTARQDSKFNPQLPVDLIFYVNAATASTVTRRTLSELGRICSQWPQDSICSANPLYVAVTSHRDWATGIILPIANAVFPALSSDHLHLISAANTHSLHSHYDPVPKSSEPEACSGNAEGRRFDFNAQDKEYSVTPICGRAQKQFWIFNVGKNVMSGHGDVWNAAVTDLVVNVLRNNESFQNFQ